MKKLQAEQIKKLLSDIDIDVSIDDIIELETQDDLYDYLDENEFFNVEIIYHYNAMQYLLENDASLQFSLELAHDMGYSIENLNSERLASLLASENMRDSYNDLVSDIDDILEN